MGEYDSATEHSAEREKAMRDLWSRTLSQIETSFGKIVYLASLRDENTGRYQHHGLAQRYSHEEAHHILRGSHEKVFADWLNFSLEEQRDDLRRYLATIEGEPTTVLQAWMTLGPYRRLIPASAGDAEQQLYTSDLELILELLRNEFSV